MNRKIVFFHRFQNIATKNMHVTVLDKTFLLLSCTQSFKGSSEPREREYFPTKKNQFSNFYPMSFDRFCTQNSSKKDPF